MLLLAHLIRSHGLHIHSYADDTQLYLAFQNPKNTDAVHNGCIKVERCLADTKSSLADVTISSLEVARTRVDVSDGPVRNLDNSLSMSSHVDMLVQSA